MKKFILIAAFVGLVGCGPSADLSCNNDDGSRTAVKNNIVHREEIRTAVMECMKGNTNRDVVYNDTNELAKTCQRIAISMYGGVNTRFDTAYYGTIEKSLYDCGEIK